MNKGLGKYLLVIVGTLHFVLIPSAVAIDVSLCPSEPFLDQIREDHHVVYAKVLAKNPTEASVDLSVLRVFLGDLPKGRTTARVVIRTEWERAVNLYEWDPLKTSIGDELILVLEPFHDLQVPDAIRFAPCPVPLRVRDNSVVNPVGEVKPPIPLDDFDLMLRNKISTKGRVERTHKNF